VHADPPHFHQTHVYQQSMPMAPETHGLSQDETGLYFTNGGSYPHVVYSRNPNNGGNRNMPPYATYPQDNSIYYTQQG
jgi:hypothetical protein